MSDMELLAKELSEAGIDLDDLQPGQISVYTFKQKDVKLVQKLAKEYGFDFEAYMPIDKANDKAGEFFITEKK
jgi:hypothetical protein